MVKMSEDRINTAAKKSTAKVSRKLQQNKPSSDDQGSIDKSLGVINETAKINAEQVRVQSGMIQNLIEALEIHLQASPDQNGKTFPPFRMRIHRNSKTSLAEYVDVIPIEPVLH